jgi:hypothetical protein
VQSRTYEITFVGQAGAALRGEFDDCEVTVGPGTTTLRAELPDQGALHGLMQRIAGVRRRSVGGNHARAAPSGRGPTTIIGGWLAITGLSSATP